MQPRKLIRNPDPRLTVGGAESLSSAGVTAARRLQELSSCEHRHGKAVGSWWLCVWMYDGIYGRGENEGSQDVDGSSVPSGTGSAHPISTKVRAVV